MAKGFSLSKYAETLERAVPAGAVRDIEAVTCEILQLKQDLAHNIIDIGKRLIEAKAMLPHGEWLHWLSERVCFSEKTAQNYMRVAREFPNPQALADLGATKALTLLALPPEERDSFMAENNVVDMTSRELEKAIRERDEARKAAEAAKADALSAEESRAKMEADMKALKEIHVSAVSEAEEAVTALLAAQKELEMLRNRPVEVAVEVDREAVERARAEAVAEMEERVSQAETARRKAEAALEEARRQLEGKAEAQKSHSVREELGTIDRFEAEGRRLINQIHGVKLKAMGRSDARIAAEARSALLHLADWAQECAE